MKKLAVFISFLIVIMSFPLLAVADANVSVFVSNVAGDIITVQGDALPDTRVTVMVLNPGKSAEDVLTSNISAVQYFNTVPSYNGKFSCNIKMSTGDYPEKNEGKFTIIVSIGDDVVYYNPEFIFYSNETKNSYVSSLKSDSKDALLEGVPSKLANIFETYSLSTHELYSSSDIQKLATIITKQSSRSELSVPEDVNSFLTKVLVLNAFDSGNEILKSGSDIKYTEVWAKDGDGVSALYTDNFVNDLRDAGKVAVAGSMLSANYSCTDFGEPFEEFKKAMFYNLIMNNKKLGAGHIENYLTVEFKDEYEALGFDIDSLEKITSGEERFKKLENVLGCGAADITALKTEFNKIVKGGSGKDNNKFPSAGATSSGGGGGGGGGGAKPTATPAPTPVPTQTPEAEPTPGAATYTFTDMGSAAWAEDAVKYLYEKGIVNGRDEKTFAPGETVTRAEFAKMVLALIPDEVETDDSKIIKVACIGDSLTQGFIGEDGKYQRDTSYTDILQQLLGDGYEVKNFGRSSHGIYKEHEYSYTKTDEYKNSLAYEPDVVISVFGSNDMREIYWQDIKGDYTSIYVDFIKTYTALSSSPEIIIGLPGPVYEGEYIASRPEANQIETKQAILKAAEVLGVKVADTYNALLNEGSEVLPDGLHFNRDGAHTFASEIFETMMKNDEAKPEATFTDVPEDAWFSEAVIKAASKGIVNGYGDSFKPSAFITREDAAVIIYRALGLKASGNADFTDAGSISDYAKDAISAMSAGGYINGMGDGTFAPKNTLTRAQAAQLIYNALTKGGN